MGVGRKDLVCATCFRTIETCPGHFGHLKLNMPILHIGYFKALINILKCVCKNCGHVLLPEAQRIFYMKKMIKLKNNSTARSALSKKLIK
jgi:DNA-directed RNA polymerase III subunit RPC1